MIKVGKCA